MRTVLVFFDTLRRDALSPYGPTAFEGLTTPNFDRLAARSCTYDRHYVGSMPCMPARRELHTGRYNFLFRSWGPLEPFDFSMPRALHDAGVHSRLISDHYHYWEGGGATYHTRYSTWDNVRGQEGDPWIAWPGFDDRPDTIGCPHRFMTDQDEINRRWMLANGYHPQRTTFDRGISFLDRNRARDNWFLQIETFDPHEPFFTDDGPSDPALRDYDGPRFDWPAYGGVTETPEQVDHARRSYAELVRMCDCQLGRVLDAFDRYGLWESTALIVTTDHGFLLGEHDQWGKMVQPMFREVSHIPLFAWVPPAAGVAAGAPGTEPGSRCDALTQTVDLAPTILALHGVEARLPHGEVAPMDGRVLWNVACDVPRGASAPGDRPVADQRRASERREQANRIALFGLFGGHVAATDGHQVYMRAPDPELPIYEHTLMPWNMREPAPRADRADIEIMLLPGFANGEPLMRYPGRMHSPKLLPWLHDLHFDWDHDPGETTSLADGHQDARQLVDPAGPAARVETAGADVWLARLERALIAAGAPQTLLNRLRVGADG